jgi:hypothetical protein
MKSSLASSRGFDWGRIIVFPPLLLLGILASLVRAPRRSPRMLCRGIVGNRRRAIETMLGPPHASALHVWYYPLRRSDRSILAIEFDDEIARAARVVPFGALTNRD